ncbi:chromosome-associated kinesin KIF4-like [Anopheles ziemanni]|uniref:chromosome-associated kinesin KIF4-like n=1 Tax=Anopheles coustani TaxID=139045 RepID=UPI00265ACB4D|nr:chromosome-associated kinesin KIF4-like [Anopheles coustani]XP_058170343.1 chromosome-associated kinesin KIF4-like [Anopheles ziemanni]
MDTSLATAVPDTVQVAVRIRPLSQRELAKGYENVIVQPNPPEPRLIARGQEEFTFTEVFGPEVDQLEVYERSVKAIVLKLLDGFNVSILAYGQTGSGKTYTIGTSFTGSRLTGNVGILPRALLDIFSMVNGEQGKAVTDGTRYRVCCSFMELYQDHVYDLLSHRQRYERLLGIREDVSGGVFVKGLTELNVSSAEEALRWLGHGAGSRATAPTSMNKESNRSHTIFTVIVRSSAGSSDERVTISKLHFVDLAGSERAKKSRACGDRLRECIQINKGLLALGNVISALASHTKNSRNTVYVSYRDSKLTRLLQNSLGGNSITLMLACVSPACYNLEETLSTLRYADRALAIRNKPTKSSPSPSLESGSSSGTDALERLTKTVSRLRVENEKLRQRISAELRPNFGVTANATGKHLIAQNRLLHGQLKASFEESTRNELRASIAENALGRLEPLVITETIDPALEIPDSEQKSAEELRRKCLEVLLRYRTEYEALRQRPTAQQRFTI